MVTVYSYSDEVVFFSESWFKTLYSTPVSLLDGTYGLVEVRSEYDFFAREWIVLSNTFEGMDVISGQAGSVLPLSEGQVNYIQLAQLSGGWFVQSGFTFGSDGIPERSFFQILGADGTSIGQAKSIGADGIDVSAVQRIVPLDAGGFILSWNQYDFGNSASAWDGAFQIFGRRGNAVTEVIEIVQSGNQGPPEIAVLPGSQFVATWIDTTGPWTLRGQKFGLDGAPVGAVFTLATEAGNYTSDHKVAALGDGTFMAMWRVEVQDLEAGTATTTYTMRRFSATGTAIGNEVDFASLTVGGGAMDYLSNPQMIVLADGRIAVAWTEHQEAPLNDLGRQFYSYCLLRIYEANGTAASPVYSLGADDGLEAEVSIVALEDGRIAASWQRYNPVTSAQDTVTQIFDARSAGIELNGNGLANQYAGSTFGDVLQGFAGGDTLFGNDGNDSLFGGKDNDMLLGGFGSDRLSGGDGDDYLSGFDGADRLAGGRGNDLLFGGRSADVFVFAPGDGADRIKGFVDGQDRLDLSAHGFTRVAAALRHFEAVDGGVRFVAGNDTVLIGGITLADLSGADLILA